MDQSGLELQRRSVGVVRCRARSSPSAALDGRQEEEEEESHPKLDPGRLEPSAARVPSDAPHVPSRPRYTTP